MKNSLYFSLINIILITVIFLNASCEKEAFSEVDFINELKLGWYVKSYIQKHPSYFHLSFDGDSIVFNHHTDQAYYITDSNLCSIPGIESIQFWTFTEEDGQLRLETDDFCGVHKEYIFKYSNYRSIGAPYPDNPDHYSVTVDAELIGQDTIIFLNYFNLVVYNNYPFTKEIDMKIERDNYLYRLRPIGDN